MILTKRLLSYDLNSDETLFVNTLSGAMDVISSRLKCDLEKMKSGQELEMEDSTRQHLIMRKYLFDSVEEEERQFAQIYQKIKLMLPSDIRFVVCPTFSCNFRCIYCYERDLVTQSNAILTEEQCDKIFKSIDIIMEREQERSFVLELFGGEPFLPGSIEIVRSIIVKAKDRRLPVTVITNGVHVIDYGDLINKFHDVIDKIQITLDGPANVHNRRRKGPDGKATFDIIVRGIDFLLEKGINVALRMNVDSQNLDYLTDFVDFIEGKRWIFFRNFMCDLAPVTDHAFTGRVPNLLPEHEIVRGVLRQFPDLFRLRSIINFNMFKVLNHVSTVIDPSRQEKFAFPLFTYCEANDLRYYVFGPDDNIYACPESVTNKDLAIGKFTPELYISEQKHRLWKRDIFAIPRCRDCEIATFCGGGCAMGNILKPTSATDLICENTKGTLLAYLDMMKTDIAKWLKTWEF